MIGWHEFWLIAAQSVIAIIIFCVLVIIGANCARIARNRWEDR